MWKRCVQAVQTMIAYVILIMPMFDELTYTRECQV